MRRVGRLFDRIADRENLRLAVHKALRGKRSKWDAQEFVARLDANLDNLSGRPDLGDVSGWESITSSRSSTPRSG